MTNRKRQLYTIHDHVDLPETVLRFNNGMRIFEQRINRFPFVSWLNGRPCETVNAYLIDCECLITGDSLKTYASELSPIVRYCGERGIGFEELDDSHFFELSEDLQTERSLHHPTERARNNNSVRTILSRTILFLLWYQDHLLLPTATPLIGEKKSSPRIAVRRMRNPHVSGVARYYYVHRAMPTPDSREPKRPLSLSIIEDVELIIEKLSDLENQKEPTTRRFRDNARQLAAQLEYVRARRRFMIWIMKRTGLRPAEMTELPLKDNEKILQTKRIVMPTKKRRRRVAPLRSFAITLKDATIFKRYLTSREQYIEALKQSDPSYTPPDAVFLAIDGKAIRKTSLEKDFERLVKACGYKDVQACFSMFRHRFITYEVIVHLKEFMGSSGKTRHLMTDADYRSILKRVATKTGHGSEESLWHYIDLAWVEMNVWANVDKAIERLHAADRLFEELLDLRRNLHLNPPDSATQILDVVSERLSVILHDARDILEVKEATEITTCAGKEDEVSQDSKK